MDISHLAEEIDLTIEYIHVNRIIIDTILERGRAMVTIMKHELYNSNKCDNNQKETLKLLLNSVIHLKQLLNIF
jgi:hypothetical protein